MIDFKSEFDAIISVRHRICEGLATIGLAGAGIGVGVVFGSLIIALGRNPSEEARLFKFLGCSSETLNLSTTLTVRERILSLLSFLSTNTIARIFVAIYIGINALLKQFCLPLLDLHLTYKEEKIYYIQVLFALCLGGSHRYPWLMTVEASLTALLLNINNGHTLSQLFLANPDFFTYYHTKLNKMRHSPHTVVRWFGTQAALGSVKGPGGSGPNGKIGLIIVGVGLAAKLIDLEMDRWNKQAAFSAEGGTQ